MMKPPKGIRNNKPGNGRWAPPKENDTGSYVRAVSRQLGVLPGQAVGVHDAETIRVLVVAIIRHENGLQP